MAPPVYTVPAPPPSKKLNDFDRFINKNGLQKYKTAIQQWAGEFGVPALWVAATLRFEGGTTGQYNKSGRGFGLAQIDPQTWFGKMFPPTGEQINEQWASQDQNAIAFAAWLLSTAKAADLTTAYKQVYNPGYTSQGNDPKGLGPASLLTGYKVTVSGATPTQKATGAAATAQAKAALPADQIAVTQRALDPIYLAWTGRKARSGEVLAYIKNPISQYELENRLANPKLNPRLFNSPMWLTNAPKYEAVYKSVYGDNVAPPKNVLLYGIVHNQDQSAFQQYLRDQPTYINSNEFKQRSASYAASVQRIYGTPDASWKPWVEDAVKKGLSQDQFERTLRDMPQYKSSAEWAGLMGGLAQRMGLVQNTPGGAQTDLGSNAGLPQTPTPTV